MPSVVPRKAGAWEIRESVTTSAGPRSRTLARFRVLSDEVVAHALGRARMSTSREELRRTAVRAGAPVAPAGAGAAASQLLREIHRGQAMPERLRRLVADAAGGRSDVTDAERSAGEWAAATPGERGETLRDLLDLADALPGRRDGPLRFPRLESDAS
jgi:hypothetical protein